MLLCVQNHLIFTTDNIRLSVLTPRSLYFDKVPHDEQRYCNAARIQLRTGRDVCTAAKRREEGTLE